MKSILNLFEKTQSDDVTRYDLSGVYFCDEEKVAVATDGHRLVASKDLFERHASFAGKILPLKKGQFLAEKIDGKFPDWKAVIPTGKMESIELKIPEFFKGLDQRNAPFVSLVGLYEDGSFRTKPNEGFSEEGFIFGLNARYLAAFAGMNVAISHDGKYSPLKIETEIDGMDICYIAMPMEVGK